MLDNPIRLLHRVADFGVLIVARDESGKWTAKALVSRSLHWMGEGETAYMHVATVGPEEDVFVVLKGAYKEAQDWAMLCSD